ncbi:MAG: epoxyqueuosine reductase QueH [Bacilli bacterium]|nr:epoxyqueuosine reductase QueH [Bacilli bacterium]
MKSYKEFESFLESLDYRPKLLLHSCCGPCSSSVLEFLTKYFDIDVLYYNPNIYPEEEFVKRKNEQEKLLKKLDKNIKFIEGNYNYDLYKEKVRGLEQEPEGGLRCKSCISLRMEETCRYAKEHGYDFFTTTLSVSPHKNSKMINEIGFSLEKEYNMPYLYSDFKKKEGYKRSIVLSKEYDLYRQDYCGCQFSLRN